MALLAHHYPDHGQADLGEREAVGAPRELETGVCVRCVICGSARSQTVCSTAEMATQQRALLAFYRRRWREQNAATAADRAAFTQDYLTDVVRCRECGLLYRNPRPRTDSITNAYRRDRYDDEYLEQEFHNQRRWARGKLPVLARYLAALPAASAHRPRVLEVGSFVGGLLAEGRDRGWEMFGVDPGDEVTAFCRANSLPVFHGTLEQADLHPGSFDAVVVWNTFDQLPDPHPMLEAAVRALRSGGLLTIRIPNGTCYAWAMGLLPRLPRRLRGLLYRALAWNNLLTFPYLYGYSKETVTALTAAYGFRPVATVPDTLLPVPPGQIKRWAALECRCYQWLWRASWQATTPRRYSSAPWLDLYFERAASDGQGARESAADRGLGLIPVYAPLSLRQSCWNRAEEGG